MVRITGDGFRDICSIVVDRICDVRYDVPDELLLSNEWKAGDVIYYQQHDNNNWVFCQPEFFQYLEALQIDLSDKILFTHRSDDNINDWDGQEANLSLGPHINYNVYLNPKKWFGLNVNCNSVKSLPSGLYEKRHNKHDKYDKAEGVSVEKKHLLYLNFNPNSNKDRLDCLKYTGLPNYYNYDGVAACDYAVEYNHLLDLKSSYFVLSPNGFGIDCHRHWESLYMGAIPVVTRSKHIESLSQYFPFVILDKWEDFNQNDFSKERYESMWDSFDKRHLDINYFVNKLIEA
jgi:hypothetical protein